MNSGSIQKKFLKRRITENTAIRLFILASVVAAGLLLLLAPGGANINAGFEQWKVATQFVWTAIIGGGVGLLFRKWEGLASKRAARREFGVQFYKDFSVCHSDY